MIKLTSTLAAIAMSLSSTSVYATSAMASGKNGWQVSKPLLTVGENINGYTPPGLLDGLGAMKWNSNTVRVFVNHEIKHDKGYAYTMQNGNNANFSMTGARISYFDIDKSTREIVDAGLAYEMIYDANQKLVANTKFLANDLAGFSRFCSGALVEAGTFNGHSENAASNMNYGLKDTIYFTGEELGGEDNPVGGAEWALDVKAGALWQVPAMGRGAWENIAIVDTGNHRQVAFIIADDTAPFEADGDGVNEAAPLYLYLGEKKQAGNFLERNGLIDGQLYVWVADSGETSPADFNASKSNKLSLLGRWLNIDNSQNLDKAREDGVEGYDEYGYPTQRNLWTQAKAKRAFGFSRPEDVAFNPDKPNQVVLASTGRQTYADGADAFGTIYIVDTDFSDLSAKLTIIYDGDADPSRQLRSPDNLDWADNGRILIQEDKAVEETLEGEVLFGDEAVNPNEAGIIVMDPKTGARLRVANINREVVLDASIENAAGAIDKDAGKAGEWESSGILDVSKLFGEKKGSLFLFNVQAHGIEKQPGKSRIQEDDLVEGGQMLFLQSPDK